MNSSKVTKQIALAAGFLALTFAPGTVRAQSSSQAQAQDSSQATSVTQAPHTGKRGAMAGLNLTDDQKNEMKTIHETTKSQMDAVKKDESLTFDQKEAKIHELRHGARVQMAKLLTPDQRQQMKANMRAMRAERREKRQQQPQAQPQG